MRSSRVRFMPLTTTTTTTTTVFWPLEQNDDNDGSGAVPYGWNTPGKICVAGVLPRHCDISEARQRLHRRVWASGETRPTILEGLDLATLPRIYYHRYPSQSLRFYQLDSTLRRTTEGIDYTLIHQFNQAHQVWSIVNGKPIRLHRPTAGFLLNVAAHVIRPIIALCRYGRIPFLTPLLPHSALAQQIKVRGRQAEAFLLNVDALSKAQDETYIPEYAQLYTRFFNDIWLILNDYILGFCFGTLLCDNAERLSMLLSARIELHCLRQVEDSLVWLDSWPAGLKLNTELSTFYSKAFISIVQLWGDLLIHYLLPYSPIVLLICGYASMFGGLTIAVATIIDIVTFLVTPHVTVCYALSRLVYSVVKNALGGLWAVFRGKRHNVLRNRMDTWDFDVDQLVFGTMLFTLLAFLFPTIFAYYAVFAVIRVALLLFEANVEALLAFMNHFPLFKLMLRIKDSARLPGAK
ncbi:phosphatidylinositol N-acetylglucosaminyltransferase subunit GPI1 [Coprinopsis sp. MPI-PUGE-AT-0042]|nr:phosphatidylinositol N-acetylglucosaminyltransferase subunit GPI1 [Coprinopsis sp. MPI-PUGE-AT-0042]